MFAPIPTIEGGYRAAVIDPPWSFRDKGSRAAPDQATAGGVRAYSTMSTEDVAELPIPELLARDALVALWAPDTHIPDALWLLAWWGLGYKHLVVWGKVKLAGADGRCAAEVEAGAPAGSHSVHDESCLVPQIGMGHWFRKSHEVALVATRGRPEIRDHAQRSLILAPRGRHSAKPEELQSRIERLISGPYLELFARRQRPGWTCWGDELTT